MKPIFLIIMSINIVAVVVNYPDHVGWCIANMFWVGYFTHSLIFD